MSRNFKVALILLLLTAFLGWKGGWFEEPKTEDDLPVAKEVAAPAR